jgi:uncharacterized protein YcnI
MNKVARLLACFTALSSSMIVAPRVASAHAVVFPRQSTTGAYEKYVLRVPNEKGVPTTRVEIRFPSGLRVVSFADVAGWQLQEVRDSANAVISAVWTGTLPPERFAEFPFVAVNPKESATLSWPAFQTYSDGEKVEWTGAADSDKPASSTKIEAPQDSGRSSTGIYLGGAALLLSLISLGLVLRRSA